MFVSKQNKNHRRFIQTTDKTTDFFRNLTTKTTTKRNARLTQKDGHEQNLPLDSMQSQFALRLKEADESSNTFLKFCVVCFSLTAISLAIKSTFAMIYSNRRQVYAKNNSVENDQAIELETVSDVTIESQRIFELVVDLDLDSTYNSQQQTTESQND